ncbi:outer membrane protein [Arhodomonas sp. AD133]|uniref:outer membrane protein n=1 Tax=Arhodomonas sp. AD133 TaxID=3415009 RepID=UPI003EB9B7F2
MSPARVLCVTAAALAAAVPAAGAAQPLDFRAVVSRETADLAYDDGRTIETRETRAGAELWEPLAENVEGGVVLGFNWVSQDGDPATEGEEPDGGYGGLRVRGDVPLGGGLAVEGAAGWQYHRASADASGGDVTLSWYTTDARAGLAFTQGAVTLAGGATVSHVDGERRVDGRETVDFDNDDSLGGYLRASFATAGRGRIELSAASGPWAGVSITFARRF